MPPIRLVIRWSLTLIALLMAVLALLTLVLRLLLGQADAVTGRLESLLSSRLEAVVTLERLDGGLTGFDPRLELADLDLRSREGLGHFPLLEVERARLRLDTLDSLRLGMPRLSQARLEGVTLHLYQDQEGRWRWPAPAEVPEALTPEGRFDLQRLDFWVGVLLRQRAWVEDLRVVLHGQRQETILQAPRLLMTGDARRAHLEGEVRVAGQRDQAMRVVMELVPGPGGLQDFSAALQADMQLKSLLSVVELLGVGDRLALQAASGQARLWGRWQRGALADARLDLEVPLLSLQRQDVPPGPEPSSIVLRELSVRGQWLRQEEGWEAWLEGDAESADWAAPVRAEGSSGLAVPRYWHATGAGEDWWLTTSGFELGALAAWQGRLPLPEGLARTVATLAPRGRVTGLALGRREGEWLARASATDVEVSPWQQAPGGGPLDIWVESRNLTGHVEFAGGDGTQLYFPQLFQAPMRLTRASGQVDWAYDGPHSFVSGRGLEAVWQGAGVTGGFGLSVGGQGRGGFGLSLDFHDVDAVSRPLTDWLPMPLLRQKVNAELGDWLAAEVAGRVSQGTLRLHVPIRPRASEDEKIDPTLELDLEVVDGRLPFAPDWPALTQVTGRLAVEDETLSADIDHAVSLGVRARQGEVRLAEGRVAVTADLAAGVPALRDYLAAMPVEGMAAVQSLQGEGEATAELSLTLPLASPEALALDIEGRLDRAQLRHAPSGLEVTALSGPLAWHQAAGQGALSGELAGRLLGGPVRATLETDAGEIALSGTATAEALLTRAGIPRGDDVVQGRLPWQGHVAIGGEAPSLHLESTLEGLSIALPAPLGKAAEAILPLRLDLVLEQEMRLRGRLGSRLGLRWRERGGGQGQVWIGREAPLAWPEGAGWSVLAYLPRLAPRDWAVDLAPLAEGGAAQAGGAVSLSRVRLETDCLSVESRCLGSLSAQGRPDAGGWRLDLGGSLLDGHVDYRPGLSVPLDIALERLTLDGLVPSAEGTRQGGGRLFDELAIPPEPVPFPAWVDGLPVGRLRIADLTWQGQRFGPLNVGWQAGSERLRLQPLGLTLGEISAHGDLVWEATGSSASLTRARLDLDGGDAGTALAALGQPVVLRSAETRVQSQLAWPGAPWQFALERSRGSLAVRLRDGRFVHLESPSARLVGLLNVDYLLRRLRLDFSDVTGQGTAFDRVSGDATLYGGVLETRGPVMIEGPATRFTLDGSVALARRELDMRLGVTVPVSRNLPLAAVIAGAPVVGGALYLADKLFGDAIDRVTRIHYRVRGPWTSPQISLESAE
ncbi:YhdP family protein [Halomonas cerina]|uniref:Uncharacterized protein (TIGR02099 family) n=1 Tax=Halomonas cerina TaxID=447424 RepID=A0A839VAJ5_9GAMM|nr:AsmA-like C-terminal region-containing protein [Halomonas cerina]MBB3189727.1 uncharacterized protein (TIGR02099 family) [Halomonas cerina]